MPSRILTVPNQLTFLRLAFLPVFLIAIEYERYDLALGILVAAGVSDALDGVLARGLNQKTPLGAYLDPIADKLLISAAFISLVQMGLVPAWMVVIIIGREFIIVGLRDIATSEGLIIPASALSKTKMVLQVVAGCAVILTAKHPVLKSLGVTLMWLMVLSAVLSAIHYFQMFWGQVNFRMQQRHQTVVMVEPKEKPQDVLTR